MKKAVAIFTLLIFTWAVAAATGMGTNHVARVISATRIALATRPDWYQDIHRLFAPKLIQLLDFAQKKGYTVTITSALRAGDSGFHGRGGAVDLNLAKDGQVWGLHVGRTTISDWEATGIPQYARSIGLRWGGDFTQTDVVHFDIGATHAKTELT